MVEYIFDAMRVMTKNQISINGFEGVLSLERTYLVMLQMMVLKSLNF